MSCVQVLQCIGNAMQGEESVLHTHLRILLQQHILVKCLALHKFTNQPKSSVFEHAAKVSNNVGMSHFPQDAQFVAK
jgi:hypothetical protein